MGQNNKRVADRRTDSDWLSRDPAEVDAYVADPLLGFELTVQGWIDVFTGLMRIGSTANIARVRKDLPLYIFSGSEDPVGGYGKGVHALTEAYRKAGVRDVTERIYEGGRHEMLNEVNREEVQADLVAWLDRTLDRLARSAA